MQTAFKSSIKGVGKCVRNLRHFVKKRQKTQTIVLRIEVLLLHTGHPEVSNRLWYERQQTNLLPGNSILDHQWGK